MQTKGEREREWGVGVREGRQTTGIKERESEREGMESLDESLQLSISERVSDSRDQCAWRLTCSRFLHLDMATRGSARILQSQILPSVLNRYPKLAHLDLSSCIHLTNKTLLVVAQMGGERLLSLNLSKVATFTSSGLEHLSLHCPSLALLDLSYCYQINDWSAISIARMCSLQTLRLAACRDISDSGLCCIVSGLPQLSVLSLKWCSGISDLALAHIAYHCRYLQTLDISFIEVTNLGLRSVATLELLRELFMSGCRNIGNEGLIYLFQNGCKLLQTLDISKCLHCHDVTKTLLKSFQRLNVLQSLKFDGCDVARQLEALAIGCNALQELSLGKCRGVSDFSVSTAVQGCRRLKKLDLTCCRDITDATIFSISKFCRGLLCLRMESCNQVTENGLHALGHSCHYLEEIDLTDTNVNDIGLLSLSQCSELQIIKLGICPNISDIGLSHIASHCSKLKELDVYRSTGVSDAGIISIAEGCPGLRILNLSYCVDITDAAFDAISQHLHDLFNLEMRGCFLVSSQGIRLMAKGCWRLVELDIKRCESVDDQGALALAAFCTSLREINLSYTGVTDCGLLAIAKLTRMQNMKLVHLRNVSIAGFVNAILACTSLRKIKLLQYLKQPLMMYINNQMDNSCRFRWMEKPL